MASINQSGALTALPDWAANWLSDVLDKTGNPFCTVTETTRTPERQAQIMYRMARNKGLAYARNLYSLGLIKSPGGKVLDVYDALVNSEQAPEAFVVPAMTQKIVEVGGNTVSHHIPKGDLCVFDIGPASLGGQPPTKSTMATGAQAALLAELRAQENVGYVKLLITPPKDPAYHIELTPSGVEKYFADKAAAALVVADAADVGPDAASGDDATEGDMFTETEADVLTGGGVILALLAALGGLYWWRNRGPRRNPRRVSRALRLRRGRR